MRIGIDAHQIGARRTGAESYVYNLVKYLCRLQPNGDRFAVYLTSPDAAQGLPKSPVVQKRTIPRSTRELRYACFYPWQSWTGKFDIFHAQFMLPPLLRSRSVVTVHDLSFERFPQFFRRRELAMMKTLVPWSCRRADHIITVSHSSKRDLVEFYRLNPERITVTYEGSAENYTPMKPKQANEYLQETYGIGGPFILYVGNLEPRKNLSRLLRAFAELKRRRSLVHKLVIVGQKAWLYDGIFTTIRDHALSDQVVFTNYIPAHDLPYFYNAAAMLVYPSIFEGFGLPVVEAMACGTPVITSYGSSLEEIAHGAAVLVDPYSVASIAAAIDQLATDADEQRKLRATALARAACFSFERMAEQTRDVYHRL